MFGLFKKKVPVDRDILFSGILDATIDKMQSYYLNGVAGSAPVQDFKKTEVVILAIILVKTAINGFSPAQQTAEQDALNLMISGAKYISKNVKADERTIMGVILRREDEYYPVIYSEMVDEQSGSFATPQIGALLDSHALVVEADDDANFIDSSFRSLGIQASFYAAIDAVGSVYNRKIG